MYHSEALGVRFQKNRCPEAKMKGYMDVEDLEVSAET